MSARTIDREPAAARRPTANERFKRRSSVRLGAGLVVAVLIHILAIVFWPAMRGEERAAAPPAAEMQALRLYTLVEIPPPPPRIAPPALPLVPEADLPDEITISPTTLLEEVPPVEIPVPPAAEEASGELDDFAHFMPYMVRPELVNRTQVRRALERSYPRRLQTLGVEGVVLFWFWIDENGEVLKFEVQQSSGHPELDDAAVRVVDIMRFRPALDRGQPIRVIVALPIRFEVE